ncbi:DUF4296 domain-containing protein [Pedobacter mucosus]|uniref:DUF4296 domain-containing protein n=1 Tax=Pedobacter mucosus TaxID=2895286 RepID=UPI001EE3EA7E|nr:DUF4296 domain-containing protein [Pedobacter mucosus]UKT65803.1 DUF4296 domain-containing protein [Pedobacter mucosus]
MRKLLGILIGSILWFGCKSGIPNDVIEPQKMEKILYDIHIADGYVSTIYIQDSSKKVAAAYYDGIYKKFDIDSALYAKSIKYYYINNPEELEKMYKNITKKLDVQKAKMVKVDSLQLLKPTAIPLVK